MDQLTKQWLFSARQNRYIYRRLSPEKEIEIDVDGTVYLHLTFECAGPVVFRTLRNRLDEHFEPDPRNDIALGANGEYYYKGDVTLLAYDETKHTLVIEITCSNSECFEAFLKWETPGFMTIMPFLRRYCQVNV